MKFSTHVRCPCPQGQACPRLWRRDGKTWNNRHGSAGWAARIPTSSGTRLVRKFGYGSMAAADQAGHQAGNCSRWQDPTRGCAPRSAT